jgi:hypothetical protein
MGQSVNWQQPQCSLPHFRAVETQGQRRVVTCLRPYSLFANRGMYWRFLGLQASTLSLPPPARISGLPPIGFPVKAEVITGGPDEGSTLLLGVTKPSLQL